MGRYMMSLEGKLALVTGGGSGIGYAIAEKLVENKADVVICGRNSDKIVRAAMIISDKYNANCLGIPCDVTNRDELDQFVGMATELGDMNVDILVNNAGTSQFATIDEMTPEKWDEVIGTNLTGPFNVIKACQPYLVDGSYIFNIGSIAAKSPFSTGCAYNASKAGLDAFSEAIMLDLRAKGIRVTSLLPGSVNTDFDNPAGKEKQEWKMDPEDVAQVILDFASYPGKVLPNRIEIRPTKTS